MMLFDSAKRLERIELPAASCGVAELADKICLEDVTADSLSGFEFSIRRQDGAGAWTGWIEMSGHFR